MIHDPEADEWTPGQAEEMVASFQQQDQKGSKRQVNTAPESEVWMYHSPHQKSLQPTVAPPLSQIPTMGVEDIPYEPSRQAFSASDSTYVKLAKSGGRRDLLTYSEKGKGSKVKVETSWPSWMDHAGAVEEFAVESTRNRPALPEKPEWAVYNTETQTQLEDLSLGDYHYKAPFSLQDQSHSWNREDKLKLPAIHTRRTRPKGITSKVNAAPWASRTAPAQRSTKAHGRKQPQLSEDRTPVSMSHLLANGYQDDWLEKRQKRQTEDRVREDQMRAERRRIVDRAQNTRRAVAGAGGLDQDKPAFKLSRFANVPSRVKVYMGRE